MREIKFRAWDKIEKRMIYADEAIKSKDLLAIGLHGLPISVDRDSFKENEIIGWNRDHNLIPMQYTGLKDKKEIEMYEEDIVLTKDGRKAIIEYSDVYASYFLDYIGWCETELIDDSMELEVIGNIYDNSELLDEV